MAFDGVDQEPTFERLFARNRLPIILQGEAAECGIACLAMVSSYHGHIISLREARNRFSASLKGTSLEAIIGIADSLNFVARPVRLEVEELAQLKKPAILHWNLRHFVVLSAVKGNEVTIHDPALGLRKMNFEEVSKSFTGVALELSPATNFEPRKIMERPGLWQIIHIGPGVISTLAQMFLLAVVMQVFSVSAPLLNQMIVDSAITRGDKDLVAVVAVGMVVLLLVSTSISTLRGHIALYFSTQANIQTQTNLFRHLLRLTPSWFEKRHLGDILSRFGSLSPIQSVATTTIPALVLDSMIVIVTLCMMFIYAPILAAIEVATVVLFIVIRTVSFPYFRRKTEEGMHLGALSQSMFLETIRGVRTFKIFGLERERLAMWQSSQVAVINNSVRVARIGLWGGAGAQVLTGVQQTIMWYLGAKMVIGGDMTLGMLFAFNAYMSQFSSGATSVVGHVFAFRTASLHLERVADIALSPSEDVEGLGMGNIVKGEVRVEGVRFQYGEHEDAVLQDISLHVAPGDFVAIAGPSGQGKTTLMKLLIGLLEPTEGRVYIDGHEMRKFGRGVYRKHIGVVMQDDQLFTGTIADNVSLFSHNGDLSMVEQACRAAHVHDDIMRLPMGYQSLVGDMGSALSGGQRQRVFIARALYRKPAILFLDEGTANLDPENEDRVMTSIRSLNITRIVIAHRIAAMQGADRSFIVEGGRLSEVSAVFA